MRLMQSDGLKFLVPLLLPFRFGGWVLASGLRREGAASRWPGRVFASAFAFAAAGGGVVVATGTGRHAVVFTSLWLTALGFARLGLDLVRKSSAPA